MSNALPCIDFLNCNNNNNVITSQGIYVCNDIS